MRSLDEIRGDYQDVATLAGSTQELEAATANLVKDIPELLDALAERDAEIERLNQDHKNIESRMNDLWRDLEQARYSLACILKK